MFSWSTGKCFLLAPKDHDRPDFRKEVGLGVVCAMFSVCDFLLPANFQSSCPLKSVEEGVVEALLCREELSVELVFVVLDDPLPLAEELVRYPPKLLRPPLRESPRNQVETRVTRVTKFGHPCRKLGQPLAPQPGMKHESTYRFVLGFRFAKMLSS